MGKLVHFLADGTARQIMLDRERITIGRRADNDLCLAQPAVSGAHAAVVTILKDSFLEDLGSTNGTLVNGIPVVKHFLRDRDEIDIGREILVYAADDAATVVAPPPRPVQRVARQRKPGAPAGPSGAEAAAASADPTVMGAPVPSPEPAAEALPEPRESTSGDALPAAPPPAAPSPAAREPAILMMRVLSGTGAGRLVPLAKSETLIGRAGVQVAALRRIADEVRVVPIEGDGAPSINGTPVPRDGLPLAAGDILEIGGVRLEFVARTPAGV